MILYHYTDEKGLHGILATRRLHASTLARNPGDVRYGNGQYLSDIVPGMKTSAQLSRLFLNLPYLGHRFSHYVAIEVSGLDVNRGRPGVFVIPNDEDLDLAGRIVGSGRVPAGET